ncbi:MAG: hypothetical protein AAF211_01720 [Myxococcota bacterium]
MQFLVVSLLGSLGCQPQTQPRSCEDYLPDLIELPVEDDVEWSLDEEDTDFEIELVVTGPLTAEVVEPEFEGDTARLRITCEQAGTGTVTMNWRASESTPCTDAIVVECEAPDVEPPIEDPTDDEPSEIPDGEGDCETDADGCLVGGDFGCSFVLDTDLIQDAATADLVATLLESPGLSVIAMSLYAQEGPYEPSGPACEVSRSMSQLRRSITEGTALLLVGDDTSDPGGDIDVRLRCAIDNTDGRIVLDTDIAGVKSAPLETDEAETTEDRKAILEVRQARVCGLSVTED